MALANSSVQDRRPSPNNLSINLSSNNPFRNLATSPSPRTTPNHLGSPFAPPPAKQAPVMSKNPFLDSSEISSRQNGRINEDAVKLAADIFGDLSLDKKPAPHRAPPPRPHGNSAGRFDPSHSRPDRPGRPLRDNQSPLKSEIRRPRGLSESSVVDRRERERHPDRVRERPERTESEERRRRERRKEREERHRREKEKAKKEGRPAKKPQGLDLIDKLDVTGIYGQGLFHHDGPFDACNPHRNKKHHKAPMQAFPEGSANMALGGSGPLNARLDLDRFHGRGEESFSEYAVTRKGDATIINPTDRTAQVHGDESYGLGTSTFLEGAPASRSALQQRGSDDQADGFTGGLSRKKSLAQRFRTRALSNPRAQRPDARSPEARYGSMSDDSPPQGKSSSAGGMARARFTNGNEINPFDHDYENEFDRKGAQIKANELEKGGTSVTVAGKSTSPRGPTLTRSITADESPANVRPHSNGDDTASSGGGGGGFLNRMRSIKGGRRARPERKE